MATGTCLLPSPLPFRSGCLYSGQSAFEGQVLAPARGRSFSKRVLRTNSLKRKPINLAPSQRPKSSFLGQRFPSGDTLTPPAECPLGPFTSRSLPSSPAPSQSCAHCHPTLDPTAPQARPRFEL